jgi:hypothetical protein
MLITLAILAPRWAAKIIAVCAGIGIVVPPVIAVIVRPTWSPRTKALVAVAAAIITGLAGYIVQNGLNFDSPLQLVTWLISAFTAITVAYHGAWKPSGVTDQLEYGVNSGLPEGTEAAPPADPDDRPPVG